MCGDMNWQLGLAVANCHVHLCIHEVISMLMMRFAAILRIIAVRRRNFETWMPSEAHAEVSIAYGPDIVANLALVLSSRNSCAQTSQTVCWIPSHWRLSGPE